MFGGSFDGHRSRPIGLDDHAVGHLQGRVDDLLPPGGAFPQRWECLVDGLEESVDRIDGGDAELAHDIALHIAAMNPEFISDSDVPADVMAKEKEILIAQAADSGKPPEIIEKMVTGRLRKHLAGITLLGQPFVKDGDLTVGKLLKQKNANVKGFQRLVVGEGIEKKQENFAEEVMQQVSGN